MDECHKNGIAVKYIANEGCVVNCNKNFGAFIPLRRYSRNCLKAIQAYPWFNLATVNIYKEFLDRYPVDIVKLATRRLPMKSITDLLDYWCSDDPQTRYWAGRKDAPRVREMGGRKSVVRWLLRKLQKMQKFYEELAELRGAR